MRELKNFVNRYFAPGIRKKSIRLRSPIVYLPCSLMLIVIIVQYVITPFFYSRSANAYAMPVSIEEFVPSSAGPNRVNNVSEDLPETADTPLLTLFTTFKDIPTRRTVNENTLRYWGRLRPTIQPVLYIDAGGSDYLPDLARREGWLVYEAPGVRHGYPLVREMFLHTINKVTPHSYFVGYANSDILFTRDLIETLRFFSRMNKGFLKERGLLLSGRRINILVQDIKFEENGKYIDFTVLGRLDTGQDNEDVIDYFISTRDGYPWKLVPDFVIGKPGYDNWLLKKAVDWDLFTVDTSLTISALHQTTNVGGSDKGWLSKDVCMNRDLVDIGEEFPYHMGNTNCLKYFTQGTKSTFYSEDMLGKLRSSDSEDPANNGPVLLFQRHACTYTCHPPFMFRKMLKRLFTFKKTGFCQALARKKTILSEKYNNLMNKKY